MALRGLRESRHRTSLLPTQMRTVARAAGSARSAGVAVPHSCLSGTHGASLDPVPLPLLT